MKMAEGREQESFCYRNVQIHRGEQNTLGRGSYGVVYRASCDQLPCAAKILHPILFQYNDPTAVRVIERFEQECAFMSHIRHPHIVQHLGVYWDRETSLPALLMELLDESLTKFLERSEDPLPYHTQINLCHDVGLAVAYLHANSIIHRDLSSNNVLLAGNRAKVTDFGMSKLVTTQSKAVRSYQLTQCPGTEVYMPPEAVVEPQARYTNKIDCFSFGVLAIQILSRKFPDPGCRRISRADPTSPTGIVEIPVLETERRRNHIELIDQFHPILQLAIPCLKFRQEERPSADDICLQLATLKGMPKYVESVRECQQVITRNQLSDLQSELQTKDSLLEESRSQLSRKESQINELERQLEQSQEEIIQLRQQLAQKVSQIQRLESDHQNVQPSSLPSPLTPSNENKTFRWAQCDDAPCPMTYGAIAVKDNEVFFGPARSDYIYIYNASDNKWNNLRSNYHGFALTVINGALTTVGGGDSHNQVTNLLFSHRKQGSRDWEELLPPMSKKRIYPTAVSNDRVLVVAGGNGMMSNIESTIEVLDIKTYTWFEATELPQHLPCIAATLSDDTIYIGSWHTKAMFTCSVTNLYSYARNCHSRSSPLWHRIQDLPYPQSAFTTIDRQLVVVGGKTTAAGRLTASDSVYIYNPVTNTWVTNSSMKESRANCFIATIPGNRLIVVGGRCAPFLAKSDLSTVECATLI